MKRLLFLLISIFVIKTYAQKLPVKYEVSEVFRMTVPSVQNDYILPAGDGRFITISTKRRGFLVSPLTFESYFDLYDRDLKKVRTRKIKLNNGALKGSIKGAFVNNDKLSIIKFNQNLRKRYYSFEYITGDINTGEIQMPKEFFRIESVYTKNEVNLFLNFKSLYYQKLKYYSDVYFYEPKIILQYSANNKFFTIIHRDFQEKNTKYFIDVFNDKFEHIYTQNVSENIIPDKFSINDVVVDDDNGNVFIAVKIFDTARKNKIKFAKKSDVKEYHLYKINKQNTSSINFKPNKIIERIELVDNNNQLYAIGFYRNEYIRVNDVDGIVRLNINKNSFVLTNKSYKNFGSKLFKLKYKSGRKSSKNHEMIIRNKTVLSDGSIIVDAEDYFIPLLTKRKDRELEVREIVGDLFSLKINLQGDINWVKKIYKRQVVKPRLALHSCFSTMINNTHLLIFTDTKIKPQEKSTQFFLRDKDLQNLNGIKISETGNIKAGILIENMKSKFRFMPIEATKISDNEVIIPAKDHQFIKYFKLTF